jgi:hypothetical protein
MALTKIIIGGLAVPFAFWLFLVIGINFLGL